MQSSLGFASMVDPANGQNTPLLGQLYSCLSPRYFFLGQMAICKMLQLVVMSFKTLPIGGEGLTLTTVDYREIASWLALNHV